MFDHVELSRAPERFTESNHWILPISSLRIGPEQHASRFLQSLAYKTRRDDTTRDETRQDETQRNETGRDRTSKHLYIYKYIYIYAYTYKHIYIYIRPVRRTIADHLPVSGQVIYASTAFGRISHSGKTVNHNNNSIWMKNCNRLTTFKKFDRRQNCSCIR